MDRKPEQVLEHDLLSDILVDGLEYSFRLGELSPRVKIRLHRAPSGFWYSQSHFIMTPTQSRPHMSTRSWAEDEYEALRKAVWDLLNWYQGAVGGGSQPDDSWLVRNNFF